MEANFPCFQGREQGFMLAEIFLQGLNVQEQVTILRFELSDGLGLYVSICAMYRVSRRQAYLI